MKAPKKYLFKVTEVAKILGVSGATIFRLINRGDIQTTMVGKARRIHIDQINLLQGNKEPKK